MHIAIVIIWIVALAVMVSCGFMMHRSNWVFSQRAKILNRNLKEYETLVDFNTMMRKFWIWDIEKFKTVNPMDNPDSYTSRCARMDLIDRLFDEYSGDNPIISEEDERWLREKLSDD